MPCRSRCGRRFPISPAELDADPSVRVIGLRGAGDVAFVSGADISEFEHAHRRERRPGLRGHHRDRLRRARSASAKPVDRRDPRLLRRRRHGGRADRGPAHRRRRRAARDPRRPARTRLPRDRHRRTGATRRARRRPRKSASPARRFTAERSAGARPRERGRAEGALDAHVREVAAQIAANAPLTLRSVKLVIARTRRAEIDSATIAAMSATRSTPASRATTTARACRRSSTSANPSSRAGSGRAPGPSLARRGLPLAAYWALGMAPFGLFAALSRALPAGERAALRARRSAPCSR